MAKRKADLEAKERLIRAKKLQTAANVKKQKQDAAQKKALLDHQYKIHLKQ